MSGRWPADPSRPCIKICGLQDAASVEVAVDAGADAVGFVLVAGSPRYVDRASANALAASVPSHVTPVAVLRNEEDLSAFGDWPGWLQLCGSEDEAAVAASPCPVIRAFEYEADSLARWIACPEVAAILVDGGSGGEGTAFDHSALAGQMASTTHPIIVAGGLAPSNVAAVVDLLHPAAVDVSSGVESKPGIKDHQKIAAFCAAVRGV